MVSVYNVETEVEEGKFKWLHLPSCGDFAQEFQPHEWGGRKDAKLDFIKKIQAKSRRMNWKGKGVAEGLTGEPLQ